ncbi:GTPase HflX [Candidatus Bipolaricaulota bacterium]|nr:GTPase HflX [Candidatus Bipolaricaulota bacterium]
MGRRPGELPLIEDYLGRRARVYREERAILVGVLPPGRLSWEEEELMVELEALVRTAGVRVLARVVQRRARPDPATFVGRGKVEELAALARDLSADVLVMGDELSPAQARNLEEATGLKVVDRTQVILDIFAQRAGTREAELAVELAQLEYLLPRLRGWGKALTDPGGGIGTRGPGETRLEQDRRKVKRRIQAIRRRLSDADRVREVRRKRRRQSGVPQVAIVGYTNSGKSTLFRALTGADVLVEDKLFATLDARVRRMELPQGRWALAADTVGFIRKLPHQLIPAFRATLESVREADLLLITVDASSPFALEHLETVRKVLAQIFGEAQLPPRLHVLTKLDRVSSPEQKALLSRLGLEAVPSLAVSALLGTNMEELKEELSLILAGHFARVQVRIPPGRQGVIPWLSRLGQLQGVSWKDGEGLAELTLPVARLGRLHKARLVVEERDRITS